MPQHEGRAPAPRSTYRLQFHSGFGFADAAAISDYLHQLGISHAYASPYLKATPGSTHGYDVVDHEVVNPELGGESGRDLWVASLRAQSMSHILDIVPNHMGIASGENNWWNDVLEYGPASPFAEHFDIHWNGTLSAPLKNKIVLPILPEPYGDCLASGSIHIEFHRQYGRFDVVVGTRHLPVGPGSLRLVLRDMASQVGIDPFSIDEHTRGAAEAIKTTFSCRCLEEPDLAIVLERAAAMCNEPERLHELLEAQFYQLAHWRSVNGTINYRRFFDVNELAAIRMELETVFAASHRRITDWISDGSLAGLRIDHPDGLADPERYLRRLQEAGGKPVYVVVEKILGQEERLNNRWATAGTTGYEFLSHVNGLYVDGGNASAMQRIYERFVGTAMDYEAIARTNKRRICEEAMASELTALAESAYHLAQRHLNTRDLSLISIRFALRELTACFPIYRTYFGGSENQPEDEAALHDAIASVASRRPRPDKLCMRFIAKTLLGDDPDQRQFAQRFQQLTAPVMAKGVEDTTFYEFNRLISLNEVGCDPSKFGTSPQALHEFFEHRQRHWPTALSTLSTHDTKRSEDVRARLNALSEMPEEWDRRVHRWAELNEFHRQDGVPDRNAEYALYQSLLGAWPAEGSTALNVDAPFVERMSQATQKALREVKQRTSWSDPDEKYEAAVDSFLRRILDPAISGAFLDDFFNFQQNIARLGIANSLSQTILKLAAPGVPDTYQGTEVADFSLVDPDNRRPVDFNYRRALLQHRKLLPKASGGTLSFSFDLAKILVHRKVLQLRTACPELFTFGNYARVELDGPRAESMFAFTRRWERQQLFVCVPRLSSKAFAGEPSGFELLGEFVESDSGWIDVLAELDLHLLGLSSRLPVVMMQS